ncbi:putative BLI-3 blue-light-inducible Bli-3 protein [Lichtheimia hyalospora FSU 10163]|nr:putative BLI-3 blue-light-inducible Bli-3 protein [Lichtheimia hyalospora FSU 10163]
MDPAHDKNKDDQSTTEVKIQDLYNLIHSQRCCMMTTRCSDSGRLVSRAMAPCPPDPETPADLWFFANNQTHKFEELDHDPNVNLAFNNPATAEWASISGKAKVINDRNKIKQLYTPDLKAWFGDLHDGVHDGGVDDPRISLIYVEGETVHQTLKGASMPVQIWRITKAIWSGEPPKIAVTQELDNEELQHARNVHNLDNAIVD